MTDLMSILSTGNANIKLEITGEDLRNFSEELISRAVNEVAMVMKPVKVGSKVKYRESDVKKILGVQNKSFGNYGKD